VWPSGIRLESPIRLKPLSHLAQTAAITPTGSRTYYPQLLSAGPVAAARGTMRTRFPLDRFIAQVENRSFRLHMYFVPIKGMGFHKLLLREDHIWHKMHDAILGQIGQV
jgi:hypothetical protein